MFDVLIKTIYEDLDKNFGLAEYTGGNLHYSLGAYIRNKYLWTNKMNVDILIEHYGAPSIDDLSTLIIDDYLRCNKRRG